MKLNAQQLRTSSESEAKKAMPEQRSPLYLILENVYDTYNIGGLFRLADGLNVSKLYLCGQMERPPHTRIEKASIGTYKVVPWAYFPSVAEALEDIRTTCNTKHVPCYINNDKNATCYMLHATCKLQVVAVEQDPRSTPYATIAYTSPTALIVGNETYGILPDTLALADQVAEIPMWGVNKSLNVIVSAAIVSYEIMRQLKCR